MEIAMENFIIKEIWKTIAWKVPGFFIQLPVYRWNIEHDSDRNLYFK